MEQKSYNNVSELIKDLLTANRDNNHDAYINIDNFSGSFYKGIEEQKPDFWKELLEYLKMNALTEQSDFNDYSGKSSSVFSYINDKSDLNGDAIWKKVTESMSFKNIDLSTKSGMTDEYNKTTNNKYFWNESLNRVIAIFMSSIGSDDARILLVKNGNKESYVEISEVKNADAGYDFEKDWVKPKINIDQQAYEEVRAEDAIKSVLKNSDQLQYTNTQEKDKWMRLLMPKYLRGVEVEDLNRNFWVISQTTAAICAYLFGNNSLESLFEGILKELLGLWENVLFLWAAAAMISQKDIIKDFHIEFVPIPNSENLSYRKFDNFGLTTSFDWDKIEKRMEYLIKQYTESNIIIIPEIRMDNYKHNYYSRVEYPGILVYNRNTGVLSRGQFSVEDEYKFGKDYLVIDLKEDFNNKEDQIYVNKIGCIKEEENSYNYIAPFSSIQGTSPYYAAIRTIIKDFDVEYDDNNSIVIKNFSIIFYDAMDEAMDGDQHIVATFSQNVDSWIFNNKDEKTLNLSCEIIEPHEEKTEENEIERGFYLGELVSCQSILGQKSWSVEAEAYWGQQLYSAIPEDIVSIMEEST